MFYKSFLLFLWLNHMMIMRKYLLLCLPLFLLSACKKEPVSLPKLGEGASVTLLRVNYETFAFEGGKTFNYPSYSSVNDSLPVRTVYRVDGAVGSLTQIYHPANDTIFYGGMSWAGTSKSWYPEFDLTGFSEAAVMSAAPAYASIQPLTAKGHSLPSFSVSQIWQSVSRLDITQLYMNHPNVRVGLFLYTASQGPGDPKDWSWVWVLYKPRG